MQTAGDLVAVVVELAARVQHGHHDFRGRLAFRMHRDRNAAAVVDHRDRAVEMDRYLDRVAIPGERLVDRVIDHLEHHVVQAGAIVGIADVHARPFAHRIQALENLDRIRVIGLAIGRRIA